MGTFNWPPAGTVTWPLTRAGGTVREKFEENARSPACSASPILLEPVPMRQIGSFARHATGYSVMTVELVTGVVLRSLRVLRAVLYGLHCFAPTGSEWPLCRICGWRPGGDQPGLVGEDDRLDPVAEAELAEQAGDVAFDGGFADEQPLGEFGVG